jgi:hypothetical protein
MKRNKNRGYQKLRVWNEAVEYYKQTWEVFRKLTYELKRVASQQIASSDSVHRNIAEGYCRRSIHEYIKFYILLWGPWESQFPVYMLAGKPTRFLCRISTSSMFWRTNWKTAC